MGKTLHCAACYQLLIVVTSKNLLCIDYENTAYIHAYKNQVKSSHLIFEKLNKLQTIYCSKCKLSLVNYRGIRYVVFKRYRLVMIEKFGDQYYLERNYELPEIGMEFMNKCYTYE